MEVVRHAGREVRWAGTPADWERAAAICRRAGLVGWDSEFDGVDLRKHSAVGTARVYVWSLAVPNGTIHARGHAVFDGLVLPEDALAHPALRAVLEDPDLPKVAHNARSEVHTARNAGVRAAGVLDSQEYALVIYPELVSSGHLPYGLKTLAHKVGRVPLGDFEELFSEPNEVQVERRKKTRVCVCGTPGCRRRGEHVRVDHTETWTETVVRGTRLIPIRTIVPGHRLWDVLRVYAAEDAVMAPEILSHLRLVGARRQVTLPWAPGERDV